MKHSHNHSHGHSEGVSNVTMAFLLNFGFSILELFGGIITVLSVGTIFVFNQALQALRNPTAVKAEGMLFLAVIGIVINGASVFRMKGSKKILDKTVMMHLMEDLLGWVDVLVVSVVIYFTNWYILDPILSLGICFVIGRNIYFNLKTDLMIIMQRVPDEDLYEEIKEHLIEMDEIENIEKINMWTMDGEMHVVTASIKALENTNKNDVLNKIKKMLNNEGIKESTIEVL